MQYTADTDLAFDSVERIMRDVNNGWLLRYISHEWSLNVLYNCLYTISFEACTMVLISILEKSLWMLGVVILLLMMATAFMGYVLPWGQMSFWGATVITNLFSAFPIIGDYIVTFLWGGFSVDNPTLSRFLFFIIFYHLQLLV